MAVGGGEIVSCGGYLTGSVGVRARRGNRDNPELTSLKQKEEDLSVYSYVPTGL